MYHCKKESLKLASILPFVFHNWNSIPIAPADTGVITSYACIVSKLATTTFFFLWVNLILTCHVLDYKESLLVALVATVELGPKDALVLPGVFPFLIVPRIILRADAVDMAELGLTLDSTALLLAHWLSITEVTLPELFVGTGERLGSHHHSADDEEFGDMHFN